MSKKNRIQEAFNYLKYKGLTTSQKDLSEKMGANRVSVSRALNGDESYLTDDFIERFNTTFGSVFSVCWLLTGEGGMLRASTSAPVQSEQVSEQREERIVDAFNRLFDILDRHERELEAIRKSIGERNIVSEKLITLLESKDDQINNLIKLLSAKEQLG